MSRVCAGDAAALAALYDRHAAVVYALAQRIVRSAADAEEVVLDAFLQVWQQAASFDSSRASVAGWLLMITRSRALDRVRHTQGRSRREEGVRQAEIVRAPSEWAADHSLIREQHGREARREFEALPAMQRIPVELAFYEGLTHSEIADILCQPLGTVKTRIRLALHKMRDGLNGAASVAPPREPSPFTVALANHLARHPRLKPASRSLRGLRVLVVDDDGETVDLVTTVLQSAGATVVTAQSTSEGLARLGTVWPDLILADITMPRDDGYSLLRQARALADASGLPLRAAAFTARGPDEGAKARQAGFVALVAKPIQPHVLVETVASLTGRAA